MEQNLISNNEENNQMLSVKISSDRLKHLFYMLHGEPSTRTRSFDGAILVSKNDIETLIKSLVDQLKIAHVRDLTIMVGIGFEKEIIEKSFQNFKQYSWSEPDKTKEVIIKIHFLYEDFESGNPLKHSLFIRIAKEIKTGNLFQLLSTSDSEKLDNIENLMCPVFCRTDHVNDKLSKNLLNVVGDWHAGQKQPNILSDSCKFIRKHRKIIARIIHYSIPTAIVFILCYFAFSIPKLFIETYQFPAYVSLIILSKLLLMISTNIFGDKASQAYRKLSETSSKDVVFDITKGDDKEYSEVMIVNKKLFNSARSIFLWANGQALATSLIAAFILEWLKK